MGQAAASSSSLNSTRFGLRMPMQRICEVGHPVYMGQTGKIMLQLRYYSMSFNDFLLRLYNLLHFEK
jgi:hypothetical protein